MLVFDHRPPPSHGRIAGFHALIIGISVYPHLKGGTGPPAVNNLGLVQLEGPALTAYRVYDWLIRYKDNLQVPLQTVRLLIAPSPQELNTEPGIAAALAAGATNVADYVTIQQALNDWREDLAVHRDSVALFFFSGHGLGGTGEDALMLPSDFGDPAVQSAPGAAATLSALLLQRTLSITDIEQGMAPPPLGNRRTIAHRQVYLVDACRNRPRALPEPDSADVPTVWTTTVEPGDDTRELSILLATINNRLAYVGKPGEATVFGQALLECLEGAAADNPNDADTTQWAVSTTDISERLQERMDERTKALRVTQAFRGGRQLHEVQLVTFTTPPSVIVTFPVVGMTHATNLQLKLALGLNIRDIGPLEEPPREYCVDMGRYAIAINAVTPPPPHSKQHNIFLRPPRSRLEIDL
jgi:hypothetical protein